MATFDWLPALEGKHMTYYQIGALIFSLIDLILAFLSYLLYLILSKISTARITNTSHRNKIIDLLKHIAYVAIFVWLSFIPLVCAALDVINIFEGMVGMFAIYMIGIYVKHGLEETQLEEAQLVEMQQVNTSATIPWVNSQNNQFVFIRRCLRKKGTKKRVLLIAAFFSIFLPLFFYKTCISFYNDEIGYTSNIFGPAINTYWARWLQLKRSCPPGPPCHVYATIPQDPTTAFFLNIHTYAGIKSEVLVFYQQLNPPNPDQFLSKKAQTYDYNQLEWLSSRKVHSVLINKLKPNTKYLLKVKYDNQFYVNSIYKTLPSDPKVPVVMLNGGDSGYTHASYNLSKLAVHYKPDIIFIGGDVAYDNNIPACSYTWDFFLHMIEDISNQVGYIVPLALALGNHDAGINQLSGINISLDSTAFFKYFPQQFDRDTNGTVTDKVPPVNQRRSFLYFKWSQVTYMILDSGYLHSFDGIQKHFISEIFQSNKNTIKFVNYHVPIYSVCQRFDRNPQRFLYALFHWIPLFDNYKVMTVFQNHVHSFKRTKTLKNNQPAANGTVYVGDGAFGAVLSFTCKPDATMDIFQVYKNKNNMWISEIREKQVLHRAIDSHGEVIDEFSQLRESYVL